MVVLQQILSLIHCFAARNIVLTETVGFRISFILIIEIEREFSIIKIIINTNKIKEKKIKEIKQ